MEMEAFCSVALLCLTICDPMDFSMPNFPVFTILSSRVCSNLCPLSRWCCPTISSSVISFSSYLQSFPASGSFPMIRLFASGGQSIGASTSASVLPLNIQGWFPLGLTGLISLLESGILDHLTILIPGSEGRGVIWKIWIDVCALPCVNQIASGNLLYSTRSSAWCSLVTYIGGMERGGRIVQERGCMITYSWFTLLYSRNEHKCVYAQSLSCVWLCNPMNWSLPGSPVHEIFQARILEWIAISYSRGSSWPRDQTHISWQADSLQLGHLGSLGKSVESMYLNIRQIQLLILQYHAFDN